MNGFVLLAQICSYVTNLGVSLVRALFVLVITTLLIAAIVTPPIYSLLIHLYEGEPPWPFARVFNRAAMGATVLMLFVLRKHFRLYQLIESFSAGDWSKRLGYLLSGLLITLTASGALMVWFLYTQEFIPNQMTIGFVFSRIGKSLLSAAAVSVIEESFFRVLLLFALVGHFGKVLGVALTSMIYALVHFITPARDWDYPGYSLFVGFDYLLAVAERVMQIHVYAALFGLFLVGCVLGMAMLRSGSLYLCIGMHAGWVLALKFTHYFTSIGPQYEDLAGVGRKYFFVAQPESWLSIILVGLIVYWCYFKARRSQDKEVS